MHFEMGPTNSGQNVTNSLAEAKRGGVAASQSNGVLPAWPLRTTQPLVGMVNANAM